MLASPLIVANNVSKNVQNGDINISILKDINLSINSGDSVAILGASGSGKTTLLTLLAGLDIASQGEIFFENNLLNLLNEDERAILRKKIGFVFQNFQLLPKLTALENVMLPLEIDHDDYYESQRMAKEWLHKVNLSHRLNHYPHQLSGGEQQRVAIARAFVKNPIAVFADEMTGNLDVETAQHVMELLFELNASLQTTIVLVTHDSNLSKLCKKHYILKDGILK